ncbi:DH domain-containing protein [Gloeophyllum trabeum ATCC 11539]|uniref:DH domain-containing protein n=1 Tax=Gloeophyllum trabeum (strain ATCC 11539 / FP-39264 / Madison 617) TaxID=670483 RepID=S7RU36_GLOTA|nr:DH domain-containing protein [Gloeophyllum trabeum ATCC 11539]EPQ58225.1 DH domain-containing protein [Gloeophyllum trabeum ATCC 11539]
MKALFNRFNRSITREKDREPAKDDSYPFKKEKLPALPPLPEWPPAQPATGTPKSVDSRKPLPDIGTRALPPVDQPIRSLSTDSSATGTTTTHQSSTPTANGSVNTAAGSSDAPKKVAFLSPPPTPGPSGDRALPADAPANGATTGAPLKTTVSRFQAAHGKDPRGSTSTSASASKTDVSKATSSAAKPTSTRSATSPYPKVAGDAASLHQSLRSGTPYSQMTGNSSRILAVSSWSEGAEEDLVTNLGPRERTRQEVLWEIVASEERYVNELVKLKETFIEPLLHPFSTSPVTSPTPLELDDYPRFDSPQESLDHLPIAARFLSPIGFRSETPTAVPPTITPSNSRDGKDHPNIDGESLDTDEEDEVDDRMGKSFHSPSSRKPSNSTNPASKLNHPRSPYGTTRTASGGRGPAAVVPFPSRSHQSLPAPPRTNPNAASTQSLGRQSFVGQSEKEKEQERKNATGSKGVLRKLKKSSTSPDSIVIEGAVPPHQLPEDLRRCLEVIESSIIEGHQKLSEGLRKRYDEQYPLVRSLADVFVSNSHILHGYAQYVLHLERALEQVDNALSTAYATKKPKKQDANDWLKVCRYLQKLEETAADKGETGLAISLSKPFQRLLKYPLLFQNLLFHTDPSTFEYESTLQMVAEVETIVRSIEDEKIQKEERDKTRDVFARIEGLEKVKQLAAPKPSRVLVEERQLMPSQEQGGSPAPGKTPGSPPTAMNGKNVKGKTSFKRLSDVLQPSSSGIGGKKDLWLVVFNDVVLRCQRTGTTSLPLVAATNSRVNSLPDLQGKAKYATTGRRGSHTKPRNLYKFIKIETWDIGHVVQPREGVVAMEDVVRSKAQYHSGVPQPRIVPMPDDDEDRAMDSDDSDRKSKMSFSYWGADKITIQKPVVKPKPAAPAGARRASPAMSTAYARESSANAKFGTRLMDTANPARPASRRTQGTPAGRTTPSARRQPQSDEGHSAKATVTRDPGRPAWVGTGSSRANTSTPTAAKRTRNISQTSAATKATVTSNNKSLASPAPSEDSGVGMYRQIIAQNPSLTRLDT